MASVPMFWVRCDYCALSLQTPELLGRTITEARALVKQKAGWARKLDGRYYRDACAQCLYKYFTPGLMAFGVADERVNR